LVGGVCRRSASLVFILSFLAPGFRFAHPGYVLAPSVIEPKPVLPPGLENFGVTRSPPGVVLARAVPQTSDAKNRIARTKKLAP